MMPADDGSARVALVVTTINEPNAVLRELAAGCARRDWRFYVIGDKKGPQRFDCAPAEFYSLERQGQTGFGYAQSCPTGHYARKNIGYLLAIAAGATVIVETDDDNMPLASFWNARVRATRAAQCRRSGWTNVYRYFSDALIWPRGLPLDAVRAEIEPYESLGVGLIDAPIQQGLANDNPDVDAIYRLIMPLPQTFRADRTIALAKGAWCPFNTQNTTWWRDAFPLLYLPVHCSFRMTDIWRSFVAQRIAWECGWSVLFHSPTMRQDRNEHDLMSDFADEVPGYLNNQKIRALLDALDLKPGVAAIPDNLLRCYRALAEHDVTSADEFPLLLSWIEDCDKAVRAGADRGSQRG
jgi:hypothetical protein